MVLQTLHGFVVTDVIFGVVSIVVLGQCDITAYFAYAFAEFCSPLRRSTNAKANSHAPAKGAGKRSYANSIKLSVFFISTSLAINDSIARSETA